MNRKYMKDALIEAQNAYYNDEVPVGCLVVSKHDEILASTHNLKELQNDSTSHAEVLAIREASSKLGDWRLEGCSVYVTLEPCPMCLSALGQSRIEKLYFGAYDPKGGALSLGYNFYKDQRLNHNFKVVGGVMQYECSKILSNFFKEKREQYLR